MSVKILKKPHILDEIKTEVLFKSPHLFYAVKLTFGRYHLWRFENINPILLWRMNQNFPMDCNVNINMAQVGLHFSDCMNICLQDYKPPYYPCFVGNTCLY